MRGIRAVFFMLAAVAPFAATACAASDTAPPPAPQTTAVSSAEGGTTILRVAPDRVARTAQFPAPADAVWQAAVRAFDDLEIPVETLDPATRRIGNVNFTRSRHLAGRPLSAFVNCGYDAMGVPVSDSHRIQMSLLAEVVGQGETTDLTVRLQASALPGAASTHRINCRTSGVLEQQIVSRVALILVN